MFFCLMLCFDLAFHLVLLCVKTVKVIFEQLGACFISVPMMIEGMLYFYIPWNLSCVQGK